ncbi:TetR/AcrR family transcriptional regulator [Paenalcaligenes sp. Me52]|uniref:TetR/AcrR family transcriptional regulator n=1 Tax=Paenalcaligenes sp. Me52 TaxID=3392038 RepID=UPI003D27F68C
MTTLTRHHWIEAGFHALEHNGHAGVSAENLARRLNVTRGSFYHHFRSKSDYVTALLSYWEEDYTHRMLAYASQGTNSADTLLRYVDIASEKRPHIEVAIRAWSLIDPLVASFQKRVDQTRLDFAVNTSQRWGASPALANLIGQAAHLCLIGGQQTGLRHDAPRFTGFVQQALKVAEGSLRPPFLKR